MTLGEKIILAMEEKGMNQDDLADALKVDKGTVSRWIRNETGIKKRRMPKLAEVLGKPVAWFREKNELEKRMVELEKKLDTVSKTKSLEETQKELLSLFSKADSSLQDIVLNLLRPKDNKLTPSRKRRT